MSNEHIAESWLHLHELLFMDCWDSEIGRHRTTYVFRGLSNSDYSLVTSLNRVCSGKEHLESNLLRNFAKYSADTFSGKSDIWKTLSLAQHHGLPTRILDWTNSPYVALHFATCNLNEYNKDGAIWCIDLEKAKDLLPQKLKKVLIKDNAICFTIPMLSKKIKSMHKLKELNAEDYVVFFEPPSIDSRIVNQYALFSMLSDPTTILSDWLKNYPDIYKKIIIPKELKWEIRDKLDGCNISERVLFPGLDGLCKWLERHYATKKQ